MKSQTNLELHLALLKESLDDLKHDLVFLKEDFQAHRNAFSTHLQEQSEREKQAEQQKFLTGLALNVITSLFVGVFLVLVVKNPALFGSAVLHSIFN